VNTSSSEHFQNPLSKQYQLIGEALLEYNSVRFEGSEKAYITFREGVCMVSTEILEAYLEDLFSVEIPDQKLYLAPAKRTISSFTLHLIGGVLAISGGLFAASRGVDEFWSFAILLGIAAPFGAFVYIAPKIGVARRLLFARVVAREIFRRRGIGEDGQVSTPSSLSKIKKFILKSNLSPGGCSKSIVG
jgi:hypothetical protein